MRSMRAVFSRRSDSPTPARTISGVIGPGVGHHLVKARGFGSFSSPASIRSNSRPVISSAEP
jgi:hypothetical protein